MAASVIAATASTANKIVRAVYSRHPLNTPMQFGESNPQRQSPDFDCMYAELFSDPIGMVKSVIRNSIFGIQ